MFGRPFMGGLERKGILATGAPADVAQAAADALRQRSSRFILGADCTVPGTPTGITCGLRLQRHTTTAEVRAQEREAT